MSAKIFGRCGTPEQWEKYKENYPDMYVPIPATVYVNPQEVCLVTSKEWADWLHRETDKMPVVVMDKQTVLFTKQELIDYYRRNPVDFAKDILGIKLYWYQELWIRLNLFIRK